MRSPRTPMRRNRSSSPPETMSNPPPLFATCFRIAALPLDFTAKQRVWGSPRKPRCNSRCASSMAARLYKYVGVPIFDATSINRTPSHTTTALGSVLFDDFFQAKCGVNVAGSTNESLFVARSTGPLIGLSAQPASDHRLAVRLEQTTRPRETLDRPNRPRSIRAVLQ